MKQLKRVIEQLIRILCLKLKVTFKGGRICSASLYLFSGKNVEKKIDVINNDITAETIIGAG